MSRVRTITIANGTEAEFFQRGRQLAALADAGEQLPYEKRVTFEEIAEIAQLLTPVRRELVQQVRAHKGSIQELADRVARNRAHVSRDVSALASKGIFIVKEEILPGHGRQKIVSMPPGELRIVAIV